MPVSLLSAVAADLNRIVCTFDGAVNASDAGDPHKWAVSPSAVPAVEVAAVEARVAPGATVVTLWVEPGLSPGQDYTVAPAGIREAASAVLTLTTPQTATAPLVDPEESEEWSHGVLRVLTRAIAQQFQYLMGTPTTILIRDFSPGDSSLFVESTLGFPQRGEVFVNGRRLLYRSKSDSEQRLDEVADPFPDGTSVPMKSVVSLDQYSG